MSNRNFDSRVITTRLQNQNYARNLYKNNTEGNKIINNPQNSDGNSSRYNTFVPGAQTEYFRGLLGGGETISIGGIVNIPPFPISTVTSSPIPTPTLPSAPIINSVTPGDQQLTVIFTAPSSDGGSPITDYEYSTNNGSSYTSAGLISPFIITISSDGTPLLNGLTYQIVMRAINLIGVGPNSNEVDGVPEAPATPPSAPLITAITTANQTLVVSFTAPYDGGSSIINYLYSTNNGVSYNSGNTASSPITITGLSNGTTYQVIIKAVNNIGEGAPSNSFSAVPSPNIDIFSNIGSDSWSAPLGIFTVEYLVVGGGGGGGGSYDTGAGGGGGGGLVLNGTYSVTPGQTYTVIVGDGGLGGVGVGSGGGDGLATNGQSSQFDTIIAAGGGLGGGSLVDRTGTGGTIGNAGTLTAPTGGKGGRAAQNNFGGGGGGGMGSNGSTATTNSNAAGGTGITYSISGSSVTYGAGGSGGRRNVNADGAAGTNNTGNGGGGSGSVGFDGSTGGKGGSGIVILKY